MLLLPPPTPYPNPTVVEPSCGPHKMECDGQRAPRRRKHQLWRAGGTKHPPPTRIYLSPLVGFGDDDFFQYRGRSPQLCYTTGATPFPHWHHSLFFFFFSGRARTRAHTAAANKHSPLYFDCLPDSTPATKKKKAHPPEFPPTFEQAVVLGEGKKTKKKKKSSLRDDATLSSLDDITRTRTKHTRQHCTGAIKTREKICTHAHGSPLEY